MERREFDRLARALARGTTRRRALALLAGAVGASWGRRPAAGQDAVGIDFTGRRCGGFARLPCPPGYVCSPSAELCDPNGVGECPGLCVPASASEPCASIRCAAGTHCCNECGGVCAPDGVACSAALCGGGEPCGRSFCAPGEFCCNPSCGTCAPLGVGCTEQFCGGEPCGDIVCPAGQVCCNPSCGICTPPGGVCIMLACL